MLSFDGPWFPAVVYLLIASLIFFVYWMKRLGSRISQSFLITTAPPFGLHCRKRWDVFKGRLDVFVL